MIKLLQNIHRVYGIISFSEMNCLGIEIGFSVRHLIDFKMGNYVPFYGKFALRQMRFL